MSQKPLKSANQYQYRVRRGKTSDRKTLIDLTQKTYQELCPGIELTHLLETVSQLWSKPTHLWLVEDSEKSSTLGCLWLGNALDPLSGQYYPHIFLLYVDPSYRRCGIGKSLMEHGETWAIKQGYQQIGLQVFVENAPAISLYEKLGYRFQSVVLQKKLNGHLETKKNEG